MIIGTICLSLLSLASTHAFTVTSRSQYKSHTLHAATLSEWDISSATDHDLTVVSDFLELKGEFDRSLNGEEKSKIKPKTGETIKSLLPDLRSANVLLATERFETEPVGFCTYNFQYFDFSGKPLLWLDDIYVNPTTRSKGAGKAMMDELVKIGKENSCSRLSWSCDVRNTRGLEFYDKIGASVSHEKGTLKKFDWIPDSWSL